MSFNKIILVCVVVIVSSCKHDPFTTELPPGVQSDTITDPPPPPSPIDSSRICDPDTVYFQNEILPLLSANCATSGCHDAQTAKKGVILDSYANIIRTGDIDYDDPEKSDIYEVLIESDPNDRMPPPPASPLSSVQVGKILKWIQQGALNNGCDECDTTNVTYLATIQPILSNYCYSCHSGSNPVGRADLTTYQSVVNEVNNANLVDRVQRQTTKPMPPGASLPACEIEKINIWVSNGMPQ